VVPLFEDGRNIYIFAGINRNQSMNTLKTFFIAFLAISFCSCTAEAFLEDSSESGESSISEESNSAMLPIDNYEVNASMLNHYLRLFHKNKRIDRIEPIVQNGDTIAYYVQFSNNEGWFLISGDIRISPVLASSEEGSLSLEDEKSPVVRSVIDLLNQKKQVHEDSESAINSVWAFLCPILKHTATIKTKGLRGNIVGMWMPMDTTIQEVSQVSAKLTNTEWHQDFPWNRYAKKKGGKNCLLGCGPVAVGQLLYKYYSSNPGSNMIPTNAVVPDNGDTVVFSNYSTSGWSNLVPKHLVTNDEVQTAIFLSWLGSYDKLRVKYDTLGSTNGTTTKWPRTETVLNEYFNYRNGFNVGEGSNSVIQRNRFCDTIIASVFSGSPVLVATKEHYGYTPHSFLIDKCQIYETQYVIRYVFDPYHVVTDDEFFNYPDWMFEWPGPAYGYDPLYDTAEMEQYVTLTNDLRVQMNWGLAKGQNNINYNNIYYLLRSRSYSIYGDGLINESFFLTWTLGNVTFGDINHWAHHFSRKN